MRPSLAALLLLALPALAAAQARGRLQTHLKQDEAAPADDGTTQEEGGAEGAETSTETAVSPIGQGRGASSDSEGGVRGSRDNPVERGDGGTAGAEDDGGGLNGGFGALSAPAVAAAKQAVRHAPDAGCDLETVKAIHAQVQPKDDEGSFEVTKRVAWKWRKLGAGLLLKPGGSNIVAWQGKSFSAGRICYPHNGHLWKVVGAVSTGDKTFPECLDNDYVDPKRCVPAIDPGKP